MLNYLTTNTLIEIICFITALVCLSGDRSWIWKYFSFYLFITSITELTAIYLKIHHHSNAWPYDLLMLFEVSFTSLMFTKFFKEYGRGKLLVLTGSIIFLICYLAETLINLQKTIKDGYIYFNDYTNDTMAVIFVIYSLYYFYLLLKDERYIVLKFSANFWWVVGVLFFYFGSTAINLYRGIEITKKHYKTVTAAVKITNDTTHIKNLSQKIVSVNKQPQQQINLITNVAKSNPKKQVPPITLDIYVLDILIVLFYSLWCYAFICRKWLTAASQN